MSKREAKETAGSTVKKTKLSALAADEDNIDSSLLSHSDELDFEGHHDDAAGVEAEAHAEAEADSGSKQESAEASDDSKAATAAEDLGDTSKKPKTGSDEWHRLRKDNHKEVERRRRENINAGIKELAALLPAPETNKSQILQRGIEYIKRLRLNEQNNIEKWTLEKLLNDQALAELTASNEKLKTELERAYREVEHWKKMCTMGKDEK